MLSILYTVTLHKSSNPYSGTCLQNGIFDTDSKIDTMNCELHKPVLEVIFISKTKEVKQNTHYKYSGVPKDC